MINMAAVKTNCSPGVENCDFCDRCYVTGNQDVMRVILFVVVCGVKIANIYVTGGVSQEPRCFVAVYLNLSSGKFICTSSHLAMFWFSLPTMVKLSINMS